MHIGTGGQFTQAAADGGQGGFITDKDVVLQIHGQHYGAARACDADFIAHLRGFRPRGGWACIVDGKFQSQAFACQVYACGRVFAHRRFGHAFGKHHPFFTHLWQVQFACGIGEKGFQMVVEAGAGKAVQVVAAEGKALQACAQVFDFLHAQTANFDVVTHTLQLRLIATHYHYSCLKKRPVSVYRPL